MSIVTFKIESSGRWDYALALGLVFFFGAASASAQGADSTKEKPPRTRLLSVQEGRSIVDAALEQEQSASWAQDCSHLTHQIYLNAGFEYPYASSFELFSGDGNFARVQFPRGGDLIVWPGHVGIVIDPPRHTFFSLVSTGVEVQDYQAVYWKSRGRPRFYRYRVQNDEAVLNGAKAQASPHVSKSNGQHGEGTVTAPRVAEENSALNQAPKTAAERAAVIYGPPASGETTEPSTAFEVPSSILVAAGNKPPTRAEVAEGISEWNDAAGHVLRAEDPSTVPWPVTIVEQFSVERVDIKHNHGWARLQIDSKVSIEGGMIQRKQLREDARWELRRVPSGWELVAPRDRTYVPHDVAVKNLAARLARLTQSDSTTSGQSAVLQQESRIASLLSALLE